MPHVEFTPHLQRHVTVSSVDVAGSTVREVLNGVFAQNQTLRGYIVDEHGALRKHVVVFVDGEAIEDRSGLSDSVSPHARIFVMQSLSGG